MKHILIVDFSPYRDNLVSIFTSRGYSVTLCESAYDAMAKLKAFDFDLIVSEVELPGDNAFDLYGYLASNYPYIPAIMITDKPIDNFFERIFREGIGNVLAKPVREPELINLAGKLMTRERIFDLANYLPGMTELKRIKITSSGQIVKAVNAVMEGIQNWGFSLGNKVFLNLLLHEMIINAVYHSHGFTEEKKLRKPVSLPEGVYVDIFFGRNSDSYGIAIDDYRGKLSRKRILESIMGAIQQERLIEQAAETGEDITELISETGRGIDLLRKLAHEYYFIIKENVRTEIILLYAPGSSEKRPSSLKIIEDFAR